MFNGCWHLNYFSWSEISSHLLKMKVFLTETFRYFQIIKSKWKEFTYTRVLLCMFYCRPKHQCSTLQKFMLNRLNKISRSQCSHKLCTVMHGQDLDLLLFACGGRRGGAGGGGVERGHLHLITAPAAPSLGDCIVLASVSSTLFQFICKFHPY